MLDNSIWTPFFPSVIILFPLVPLRILCGSGMTHGVKNEKRQRVIMGNRRKYTGHGMMGSPEKRLFFYDKHTTNNLTGPIDIEKQPGEFLPKMSQSSQAIQKFLLRSPYPV